MSTERPSKRVRQACIPCRRKKSRCPGEKPTCSFCQRLGQSCSYADEDIGGRLSSVGTEPRTGFIRVNDKDASNVANGSSQSTDTGARLSSLENQLATVLAALNNQNVPQRHKTQLTPRARGLGPANSDMVAWIMDQPLDGTLPPPEVIDKVAQLYLAYCHCQPLPLFSPASFIEDFTSRDDEVIFAVLALAVRFLEDSLPQGNTQDLVKQFADTAVRLTLQRVTSGTIELSTLQSLCLLSLVKFYQGDTHHASVLSSLVMDLSQSAGLSWACSNKPETPLQEEQIRCFWSIVLLKRLHPNLLGVFSSIGEDNLRLHYPSSVLRPPLHSPSSSNVNLELRQLPGQKDLGILAYTIQLSEVWQKAAAYTRRRRHAETNPPWSSESEYAKILARQMELETYMPYSKHRFKPANFEDRSADELEKHREYWGPWLLLQMMYHAIICLINHPLLLSLRLKGFRVASIPEIWLQHTDDLVSSHTHWIVYLIQLNNIKSFKITDPTLAHFAAIAATIYLQQSFSDDSKVNQDKRESFETCVSFCEQIGLEWPQIRTLSVKIRKLDEAVSASYRNSAAAELSDRVYIDLTGFWEILESSLISDDRDQTGLMFGSSLSLRRHVSAATEELSTRLLPEPSRLSADHTPRVAGSVVAATTATGEGPRSVMNLSYDAPYLQNEDFTVLAQSYFAQGQDFVGSLDDWWTAGPN